MNNRNNKLSAVLFMTILLILPIMTLASKKALSPMLRIEI